jgi:hypothetical protein
MRVTSEFWVSQVMRRVFSDGGFAAILNKGAPEAGSIFLKLRRRDGACDLYGPAPQTDYATDKPQERAFSLVLEAARDEEAEDKLARELRFDSDLWAVELEPASLAPGALFLIKTP